MDNSAPCISIIIPAYNAASVIESCIQSILLQSFTNFEIIIIDDGSTDQTSDLCEHLKISDKRINYIYQSNSGASSARNTGISKAKGKYLLFCDSDDHYEGTYFLKNIYEEFSRNPAQILLLPCKSMNDKTGKVSVLRGNYNYEKITSQSFETSLDYLISEKLYPAAAWNFAVRRDFIESCNIRFREGIIAEDIDWSLKIFSAATSISAVSGGYYFYIKNQAGSVTGTSGLKGIRSVISIINEWYPELINTRNYRGKYLLQVLSYSYFTMYIPYYRLPENLKNEVRPQLKKLLPVTKYGSSSVIRLLRFVTRIVGIDLASFIVFKIYNFRES